MKNALKIIPLSVLVTALLFFSSCSKIAKDTTSNSMLIIESITGTDILGTEVNFLQSDVLTYEGTIVADVAKGTFTAELLNPGAFETSHYSDIVVDRYVVSYSRSDGKNIEGVDVPYSFEGHLSALVSVGSNTTFNFVVVREAAKFEPPLVNLQDGRGDVIIQVKARIDFYGHDLANKNVMATGYLTIFFANFADKEPEKDTGDGGDQR